MGDMNDGIGEEQPGVRSMEDTPLTSMFKQLRDADGQNKPLTEADLRLLALCRIGDALEGVQYTLDDLDQHGLQTYPQ